MEGRAWNEEAREKLGKKKILLVDDIPDVPSVPGIKEALLGAINCGCGSETTEVEYSDGVKARHCRNCDIDFIIDEEDGTHTVIS